MNDSPFAINHFLKSNGLSGLDQAGPLMAQLAMFVRDHAHFRSLLNTCEPENRREMYEALSPNLRFQAKPLWEYLLDISTEAEHKQLPTIGEGGKLEPFKVPEIRALSDRVAAQFAKEHMMLVCSKCTKEDVFHAMTRDECVLEARKAGWRQRKRNGKTEAGCPSCTTRKSQTQN